MPNDRPYVVDGEPTEHFYKDVAAAERSVRERIAALPPCAACGRALCLGQPDTHYVCTGGP